MLRVPPENSAKPVDNASVRRPRAPFRVKLNCAVLILLTTIAVFAATGLKAEDQPYCLDTEPLAPNGVVLRMNDRYFRTCGTWSDSQTWRHFRLVINPDLVPDLYSEYSPSNLRVYENDDNGGRRTKQLWLKVDTGTRDFGGVTYRSHESQAMGPNGKRNAGTYIFTPAADDPRGIPEHWVRCNGWGRIRSTTLTCMVYVDVGAVYGSLLFIGSDRRGYGFIDHFPGFARDIVRVLDVADVTDELDALRGTIDIVD